MIKPSIVAIASMSVGLLAFTSCVTTGRALPTAAEPKVEAPEQSNVVKTEKDPDSSHHMEQTKLEDKRGGVVETTVSYPKSGYSGEATSQILFFQPENTPPEKAKPTQLPGTSWLLTNEGSLQLSIKVYQSFMEFGLVCMSPINSKVLDSKTKISVVPIVLVGDKVYFKSLYLETKSRSDDKSFCSIKINGPFFDFSEVGKEHLIVGSGIWLRKLEKLP